MMKNVYTKWSLIVIGMFIVVQCSTGESDIIDNIDIHHSQKIGDDVLRHLSLIHSAELKQLQQWVAKLSQGDGVVDGKSYLLYANDILGGRIMFEYDNTQMDGQRYPINFQDKNNLDTPLTLDLGILSKGDKKHYITKPTLHHQFITIENNEESINQWYMAENNTMRVYAYGNVDHIYVVFGIDKQALDIENSEWQSLSDSIHILIGDVFNSSNLVWIDQKKVSFPSISLEQLRDIKSSQFIKAERSKNKHQISPENAVIKHMVTPRPLVTFAIPGFGSTAIKESHIQQNIFYNPDARNSYMAKIDLKVDNQDPIQSYIGYINNGTGYTSYVSPHQFDQDLNKATFFNKYYVRLLKAAGKSQNGFVSLPIRIKYVYYANDDTPENDFKPAHLQAYYNFTSNLYSHVHVLESNNKLFLPIKLSSSYTFNELDSLVDKDGIVDLKNLIELYGKS